jgi:hypothetical protein
MAIAIDYNTGSQTTVITTEHTLNTTTPNTTAGVYQLFLDVANLAAGDTLEVRVIEKARTGDTARVVFMGTLTNAQGTDSAMYATPPLTLGVGWDITIKQTAGSVRAFPWSIRRVG